MKKMLITGALKYTEAQLAVLNSLGFDITAFSNENKPLDFDPSQIEAVVCNNLFKYHDMSLFENLKFIQLTSAGFDRIPIEEIRQRKIALYNARGVYSIPIAESVVLSILQLYKKSHQFFINQQQKLWQKQRDLLELAGKTVSIIGFGDIGQQTAKRLKCFDCNIIAFDIREISTDYYDEFYFIEKLDEVLVKSDIVVLTLPLTDQTRNLFDERRLRLLKDSCIVINVSRGGIIDERALTNLLSENRLLGAALDVFEKEPLQQDNPLWKLDNVIITPHNSFISEKTNQRLFNITIRNLSEFFNK